MPRLLPQSGDGWSHLSHQLRHHRAQTVRFGDAHLWHVRCRLRRGIEALHRQPPKGSWIGGLPSGYETRQETGGGKRRVRKALPELRL